MGSNGFQVSNLSSGGYSGLGGHSGDLLAKMSTRGFQRYLASGAKSELGGYSWGPLTKMRSWVSYLGSGVSLALWGHSGGQ